jgi:hypothetical protein
VHSIAWLYGGRLRCPAFSCGKPLKPSSLIHHLESRACGSIVNGVEYRGKGPETLGPLDFDMNISKDFIATLGQRSVANAS